MQCFNSQQVESSTFVSFVFLWFQLTKLSAEKAAYNWEVIGTSINTSMALINHSCDPNTFRFNMDKTSVVISSRHIRAGEEITTAYNGVQFFSTSMAKREHHLLKHYMFQCECPACVQKWAEQENLEDELIRVPNFEQVNWVLAPSLGFNKIRRRGPMLSTTGTKGKSVMRSTVQGAITQLF